MKKSPFRFLLDRILKKYLSSKNLKGKIILDVGSSKNPYRKFFKGSVYLSMDIERGKNINIISDVRFLPFKDCVFDMILCFNVLEHVYEYKNAVLEMERVLKNNGEILIALPFLFPLHDIPYDYYRFTKYQIKKLFKSLKMKPIVKAISLVGIKFLEERFPIYYFVIVRKH